MEEKERKCAMCGDPAEMTEDTAARRRYHCGGCGAVEVITKGKTSWWYHGWVRPDGLAVDGDGKRRTGAIWEWWLPPGERTPAR
jgi:ribosomal protein S27AE